MNQHAHPRVEDLMITTVLTQRETDSVEKLRREMRRARVHHVVVVDEVQHVVGIVSRRDLARPLPRGARAGDVMVRGVITVRPGDAAEHAEWIVLENGFHSLPVVGDGEQLVGIVTEHDLRGVRRAGPPDLLDAPRGACASVEEITVPR